MAWCFPCPPFCPSASPPPSPDAESGGRGVSRPLHAAGQPTIRAAKARGKCRPGEIAAPPAAAPPKRGRAGAIPPGLGKRCAFPTFPTGSPRWQAREKVPPLCGIPVPAASVVNPLRCPAPTAPHRKREPPRPPSRPPPPALWNPSTPLARRDPDHDGWRPQSNPYHASFTALQLHRALSHTRNS